MLKTIKPILIFLMIFGFGMPFTIIPSLHFFYGQASVIYLVLALGVMLYFSKGNLTIYGFRRVRFKTILIALLVAFIYALICSIIQNKYIRISRGGSFEYIPMYLLIVVNLIIAPIAEELITRGYLQTSLSHLSHFGVRFFKISINLPIVISALLFAFGHVGLLKSGVNSWYVFYTVVFAFFQGIISGYFKEKSGSIYPSILIHSFSNFLSPFFLFVLTRYALFLIL